MMRRVLGLRPRIVLALLAVTAVALAGAGIALFLPLERRLRDDALGDLTVTVAAARDEIEALPIKELRPHSPRLEAIARSLRRRGVQAWLVDRHGTELLAHNSADTAEPALGPPRLLPVRLATHPLREVSGSGSDAAVVVADLVRTRAGPAALAARRSLTDVEAARRTFRDGFVRAAGVSLLLALALGAALASRLVRRLRALRALALRVAAEGPGEAPIDGPRDRAHDEIGDLTRAFATMRRRLADQERARKAFVATASHELRTPIAALRLRLGLLREDLAQEGEPVDLSDMREQIALADEQTARLARLAGDLLDLSRLDADLPLRSEPVPLVSLCRATLAEFDVPPAPPPTLLVSGEEPLRHVAEGDPDKIAQIVRILLDNARRHAPAEAPVRVLVDGATIAVEDDGPGVTAAEAELIFERFRRGEGRGASRHAGFGLGLAIGRELARRMDGDLLLANRVDPCRFELRLPPAP